MDKQVSEAISSVEELVAAREAMGLGADDICLQLKIAPRQLLALESGDWAALPGLAFIRAVLRAYGRLLNLDVSPLVDTLPGSVAPAELRPSVSLDEPMRSRSMLGFSSGGSGSRLAWLLLIAVGLIALALFFGGNSLEGMQTWLSEGVDGPASRLAAKQPASAATTTGEAKPEIPSAPVQSDAGKMLDPARPEAPVNVSPGVQATVAGTGPVAGSAAGTVAGVPARTGGRLPDQIVSTTPVPPVVSGPTQPSANAQAPAGVQASTVASEAKLPADLAVAPPARAPRLRLRFSAESWIEVRTADGSIIITGIQQPGSERDVDTAGDLSLIIGNAHAVSAELNGKPFDLAAHTRSTVARFTLP
jgi:cytoskeleton protein RodZ